MWLWVSAKGIDHEIERVHIINFRPGVCGGEWFSGHGSVVEDEFSVMSLREEKQENYGDFGHGS